MKLYKVGDQTFSTKSDAARYIGIPRTTFRNRIKSGGGSFDSPKGKVVEYEVSEQAEASLPPLLKQISERYSVEEQKLLAKGINPLAAHVGFQIIEFEVTKGQVCNFVVRNYPFYA